MKTLFFDCSMGAAGDMLSAALLELLPDPDAFLEELNGIGLSDVRMEREPSEKCGIRGTHFKVTVRGEEEESLDYPEHAGMHGHSHSHEHMHEHMHEHAHEDDHCGHVHEHTHTHDQDDHGHAHVHACEHTHEDDHCGHVHEHTHGDGHHGHTHEHTHDHMHGEEHHGHTHGHAGHSHSTLADIEHIVRDHLKLPEKVREDVLSVYKLIAEAEGSAHGKPVSGIHFHEVGMMDAIADISTVCLLIDRIAPERIICSPVHVGYGKVRCAHGILPVPVPAAAYLLKGIPIYGGTIEGELCTPTGAALLKHFADSFGSMPVMKIDKIGYGMGKKDFPAANCLRAMLGECENAPEEVYELSCNVDDMTAEAIGFTVERLFEAGALDVYTIPIGMKKNRPGTLIRIMCSEENRPEIVRVLFQHTRTLGIRENHMSRYVLERDVQTLDTSLGPVRIKNASGYGVKRSKLEYEDLARAAKEQGISLEEAERRIRQEAGI